MATTDNGLDGWKVRASRAARETKNRIRQIVDNLTLSPNPEKPLISLSIGDPTVYGNLKTSAVASEAVSKAATAQQYDGYVNSAGKEEAREAVAEYLSIDGVTYNSSDIILCTGCSSTIEHAITALCDPDRYDNILVPCPGFPLYRTLAESIGVHVKSYHLNKNKNWMVDLNDLERQIDEHTAAIVVNNPSNPCGSVYSEEHLCNILEIARRKRVPIIADEIYERLVFPGIKFKSMAALNSDVPLFICGGLAKRFLVPGWRLGWISIHDPEGIFDTGGVRQGLISLSQRIIGCNTLVQAALKSILFETPQSFHDDLTATLYKHAKLLYNALSTIPGLEPDMPSGAMYMMLYIDIQRFPKFKTRLEWVEKLFEEESVFCLPGECFECPEYVRLVITPPANLLEEACSRIADFCGRYYK